MRNILPHARFNSAWALRTIYATATGNNKRTVEEHTRREKIDAITLLALSLLQVPLAWVVVVVVVVEVVEVVVDAKWSFASSVPSPDIFYGRWLRVEKYWARTEFVILIMTGNGYYSRAFI
jgi:hypothetical protein